MRHRVNTRAALDQTDPDLGIEVHVRSWKDRLVAASDAFTEGELFEWWLESYRHRLLVVQLCERGLEHAVLARIKARGIDEFVFVGPDRPTLVRTTTAGERRCAVRVSEHESAADALGLAGRASWIWLEGLRGLPPTEHLPALREAGYRVLAASPEVLDPRRASDIEACVRHLKPHPVDAICTSWPGAWLA